MASLNNSAGGAGSSSQSVDNSSSASSSSSSASIEGEAAVEPDIGGDDCCQTNSTTPSTFRVSASLLSSSSLGACDEDLATTTRLGSPQQSVLDNHSYRDHDSLELEADSDDGDHYDDNDNDNDLIGTPLASSTTTLAPPPPSQPQTYPTVSIAHPTPLRATSSSSSSLTYYHHSTLSTSPRFHLADTSLRIPRDSHELAYGDDHADGDDDGNVEDIEDGDEYDEDDDKYDHLFDIGIGSRPGGIPSPVYLNSQLPTIISSTSTSSIPLTASNSNSSLLLRESALELRELGLGGNLNEEDMDEVEQSFLRCSKPPMCSKKELISCLSSRSTSPGPISPLLSDEDFPSLCSSSTAPSSRRSSDGSHTPRVRFKKGCVITAVNLTWAPQTYDRAPITVAESLDMHRCKSVEDAESPALDGGEIAALAAATYEEMLGAEHDVDGINSSSVATDQSGQWQAFSPGIYAEQQYPLDFLSAGPPSPPAASSPSTAAHAQYAYASTFGGDIMTRTESPEDSAYSSSSSEAPFKSYINRNSIGYPSSTSVANGVGLQYGAYDGSSASSSSSDSESDCDYDIVERCTKHDHQPVIYRSSARSSTLRPSFINHSSSHIATVESSLGAAARELSDSLDESSRDSDSPTSSAMLPSASDDCLSSTPKASNGAGPFAWERFVTCSRQSLASFCPSSTTGNGAGGVSSNFSDSTHSLSNPSSTASSPSSMTGNFTHEISPPPQEEQPARKVQRRSDQKGFGSCIKKRFCSSDDMWESCEALGGF